MTARGKTPRRNSKKTSGDLSRRRGRQFEYKVANKLDGILWPGQDGDVEALGYRIECKLRTGWQLESGAFAAWMEQVQGYQKNHWDPGKKWALALHGGGRTPILIAVPIDDFIRLTKQVHEDSNITDLLLKNRDVIVKLAKYLENWDNEPAGSNGVGQAGGDVEDIPD